MLNGNLSFRSLAPVTLNLIIINALFFLASIVIPRFGINLDNLLGLHYWGAKSFNLAQFVSYMFLHGDFNHLFFNMFSLFMFGSTLERVWGGKRYLTYYIVCGMGAALVQEFVWMYQISEIMRYENVALGKLIIPVADYINRYFITIGASGAVFGLLLAFGMLFPNAELFLLFIPIPIKAKYFVIGYGIIELFLGVRNAAGDNIAHFAHLGGMIFGFILIKIWKKQDFNNGRYFY